MSDPSPGGAAEGRPECTIVVAGLLPADWSEWFAGFEVLPGEPLPGETTMSGVVADQAEFHGLITRIRDLGLPLISATVSGARGQDPSA